MATIKDVARLAGVSVATVSNVLNNSKPVSARLQERVFLAARELNYHPDANARGLKESQSRNIGILANSIQDAFTAEMVTGLHTSLLKRGYHLSIFTAQDIHFSSEEALKALRSRRLDGLIVATSIPDDETLLKLQSREIPVVLVNRRLSTGELNSVVMDDSRGAFEVTAYLVEQGFQRIAFITGYWDTWSEQMKLEGYKEALRTHGIPFCDGYLQRCNPNVPGGLRSAIHLLEMPDPPDAIICGNNLVAIGVYQATKWKGLRIPDDVAVASFDETAWAQIASPPLATVAQPVFRLGETAADLIIHTITGGPLRDSKEVVLPSRFIIRESARRNAKTSTGGDRGSRGGMDSRGDMDSRGSSIKSPKGTEGESGRAKRSGRRPVLRGIFLETPLARAVISLLPDFRRGNTCDVEIELAPIEEVYSRQVETLRAGKGTYDILMIDNPWLPEFAETGQLLPLDDIIKAWPTDYFEDFIPEIYRLYGLYKDTQYGLPFLPGVQILFYRKDLFEDPLYQQRYRSKFKAELKPPTTWTEFNIIARFFTRKFEPESPTLYGTTYGSQYPSGAVCEFCPRKWAYGGRAFDENFDVRINSRECLKALTSYMESVVYGPPGFEDALWDEQVEVFARGDAAMMVLWDSFATALNNPSTSTSRVIGRIGYAIVPGGVPVLGGWALAVNRASRHLEKAVAFLRWVTGMRVARALALLGGTPVHEALYDDPDLLDLYPWLRIARDSYRLARQRTSPYRGGPIIIPESKYEEILGRAVYDAVKGAVSPQEALARAERELRKLVSES
ncbi:MAG TPA: extracellular solute-binding protein [Firmicutes bacterium]|nr:extracellular solute-binding protein [Bacillota bacterium]